MCYHRDRDKTETRVQADLSERMSRRRKIGYTRAAPGPWARPRPPAGLALASPTAESTPGSLAVSHGHRDGGTVTVARGTVTPAAQLEPVPGHSIRVQVCS
jgi:hypothetical protein